MASLPTQIFATPVTNPLSDISRAPIQTTTGGAIQVTTPGAIQVKPVIYEGDGFEVEFQVKSWWNNQFEGALILKNTGEDTIENWSLGFDFEHEITNIWEAQIVEHEGTRYTLKNVGWNQDIEPSQSIVMPFIAKYDESIKVPDRYDILVAQQEATGYEIDFKVTSDWGSGFNAEISITNTSEEPIEDWQLEFEFDRKIHNFWTVQIVSHEGDHYVVKNDGYNANIMPRETIKIGFDGAHGNVSRKPYNYKLSSLQILNDRRQEVEYDGSDDYAYVKPAGEEDIASSVESFDTGQIEIKYVKNQILFFGREGTDFEDIKHMLKKYDGIIVGYLASVNSYQVEFLNCDYIKLNEIIEILGKEWLIEPDSVGLNMFVEYQDDAIYPKDPWIDGPEDSSPQNPGGILWDEENPAGAEWSIEAIKALSAWELSDNMSRVNVGVIDTIFYEHSDIRYKELLNNSGKENDHGTHVAGTICATNSNMIGMTGVAPNVNLYGVAYLGVDTQMEIEGLINDLLKKGINLMNCSRGFSFDMDKRLQNDEKYYKKIKKSYNRTLGKMLERWINKGEEFLIVASAGNDRDDGLTESETNSMFTIIDNQNVKDRIIVVGAVENNSRNTYSIANFSQLGERGDIVAPGVDIYSLTYDNGYAKMSGTSMATPHVTGTAAMVWGGDPSLTGAQVKNIILESGDRPITADGRSCNVLNALNAVLKAANTGAVTGKVTTTVDGLPVEGTEVFVNGQLADITDANGMFFIPIPKYNGGTISFSKPGYRTKNASVLIMETSEYKLDVELEESGVGMVVGTVRSAVGLEFINGAKIVVNGKDAYYSDAKGTFDIQLKADIPHKLTISKEGFTDVTYYNVIAKENDKVNLQTILQLPQEYKDVEGNVEGKVVNALSGVGIAGVEIRIRKDMNNQLGGIIGKVKTDSSGKFITPTLQNGAYTAEIIGDNIVTRYFNFICINDYFNVGDIPVTPLMKGDEMRIVLSWGLNPRDLDSHLLGEGQHIYYRNRSGVGVNLDHDDTSSYGPETITIDFSKIPPGTYKYFVNWYSGYGTWGDSEAKVQIYANNQVVAEYYVPYILSSGGNWQVFEVDTVERTIRPL